MRKYIFFLITVFILSMLSCSKETLPLENSIVMGNRDAKHKLVVFFDPDCPICSSFHKEMSRVISQRSDIAFFIKLFPLSNIHPYAYKKSQIIACSESDDKAISLLEQSPSWGRYLPDPSCSSDAVDKNLELGNSMGIPGTPSISFSKDVIAYGGFTAEAVMAVVDGNASVENHLIVMN